MDIPFVLTRSWCNSFLSFYAPDRSLNESGYWFLKREAVGVILDRGVERGEIDHNLGRELVLEMILGSAIIMSPDTCRIVVARFSQCGCNHKV